MASSKFKSRPIVIYTFLTVCILLMGYFYVRMDFALSGIGLEHIYIRKTETITFQKPDLTGNLRKLTTESSGNQRTTDFALLGTGEREDSETQSSVALVPEELVRESVKQFLEDQMRNNSLSSKAWLSKSWDSGGGKYISALDSPVKELLRNVLLELQRLQQADRSECPPSDLEDREDSQRKSSTDMGVIDEDSTDTGEFKFKAYGRLDVRRLVVYSSYRSSLTEFTVVTLSPTVLESLGGPVYNTCFWLQDGSTDSPGRFSSLQEMNSTGGLSTQDGSVSLTYVMDTHGRNYDTLVIRCSFPQPVGTDNVGGFLYLNISHGSESSELVPVFRERPSQLNASIYDLTTFQYEYVYCSAPVWTNLSASHVKQWFMYHHTLTKGNIRYFIYDNIGVDEETMAVLKPFIDMGILTVINQHREKDYDVWYHTQAPAINDCINRARFLAKWVIFWDFDEYLHLPPPLTLPVLLEQVEQKGAAWISFGNMWYSRVYCAPESDPERNDWAVERMLYRLEKPVCGEDDIAHICGGAMGHRKWIANPRAVKVGSIHGAVEPLWNGMILDTAVARINHYRGLAAPDAARTSCKIIKDPLAVNDTKVDGWWIKDDELATFVTASLKVPAGSWEVFRELESDTVKANVSRLPFVTSDSTRKR